MRADVIPSLESTSFADSQVVFELCGATVPSAILDHCEISINSLSAKYPAIYKIGITRNPVERWQIGYAQDTTHAWSKMKVLVAVGDPVAVGFVEAALIRRYQGSPGNMNIRRGGEGVDLSGAGPFFAYVVYRCLVPPKCASATRT